MTNDKVYWQAHRGGGAYEAPDNTMGANLYAWKLGGIPEADLRTTSDGVIVCLHDETPARTTDAPEAFKDRPISEIPFARTREWDAGSKFDPSFAGEKIPSLQELFEAMAGNPERWVYLDLKNIDLVQLGAWIDRYQVNRQVLFAHHRLENCIRMKEIADGVRTMLWIGGTAEQIQGTFRRVADDGFPGLDQVQLHLKGFQAGAPSPYALGRDFLREALEATRQAGIDLEVLPFHFDESSIHDLLNLGIRWFATDEPAKFVSCLDSWRK